MYINRLPQECLERLSCSLKYGPSVDWEALALEGFPSIYSNRLKLAKIGSSPHPASGLLDDLCCRGVSVETLLEALKVIGNARAVFVILEEVPELGKNRMDRETSPPPGIFSMQPEENYDTTEQTETLRRPAQETKIENQTPSSHPVSNTSLMDLNYDTTEQTETLRRPVQETRIGNRTPSRHPANNTLLMDLIGAIFPCFGHFNRFYEDNLFYKHVQS
ncbi:hypothetical protein pdam_00019862 [Pocillopora damicornis]|uniref:Death domain-containing protein n=1 Tax=Pocillopora damicornis TaxID=46731 RepID=A0A3M6UDX7_POCDA|nr:uncharacterized protein LOC113665369 [Pocillopora damicornis]RMX51835.1 hypothetical protein pdam_00019862 [Pocillopora damicornis]